MKTIDVNELATILGGNNPECDRLQDQAALHIAATADDEDVDDSLWWRLWADEWIVKCAGIEYL